MVGLTDQKRQNLGIELHSNQGRFKKIEQDIREIALSIRRIDPNSTVWKINEKRILELEEKVDVQLKIDKLKKLLQNPEREILSIEQFLNLSKNASTIVQSANEIYKDAICRIIFLNLVVNEEKVLSYQLKPPFDELLKTRPITLGRGPGN